MSFFPLMPARFALAVACVALLPISGADAQQRQRPAARSPEVTFHNRSDTVMQNLFVTPTDEASWGEDRLGSDTVNAGRRHRFRLSTAQQCRFDVRAVYSEGREETRFGVDLCQRPEVSLDGRTETTAQDLQRAGPVALFVVRNRTGNTLQTLKLTSPSGDDSDDILGAAVLADGASYTGRFVRQDGCTYDLTATFEERDEQTIPRRNLCTTREVVFQGSDRNTAPSGTPGAPGAAQEQLQVEIFNRGGITIQTLNVREARANSWGRDRLGSEVIAARNSFTLRMPRGRGCQYDVRITFDNNREEVRSNVNLCETRELAFTGPALAPGRGTRKTAPSQGEATPRLSQVAILNEGTNPIESLFISSSKVSTWGEDRLGASRIAPGDRFSTQVERDDQCNYDFRIVYQGGREERRMRQNICDRREVAFGGPNAFRIDGGGPEGGRRLVFVNQGRTDVRELYLTPVTDTHWGDDRLGSETLPRRFRLELRVPNEGGCRWDVKLVYEGGQTLEQRDQDLCAKAELSVGRPPRIGNLASTGTGFYVSTSGHVLTNQHVVDGCGTVAISRPDGKRTTLRMIAQDEGADLALLQEEGATTPALSLRAGSQTPIRAGERVVLVGYPARSQLGGVNVTEGLISGLRGALGDQSRFQYSAPTQPGNSGGPVLDEFGHVVGVVVSQIDKISGERTAQNINFGIKLDLVRTFLEANRVTPTEDTASQTLRAADILQNANQSVLPLDCLE
ncbi:S1C family serine protease [Phreatobacter stygius]|nr:serine protease [Phreatobacter stygius]